MEVTLVTSAVLMAVLVAVTVLVPLGPNQFLQVAGLSAGFTASAGAALRLLAHRDGYRGMDGLGKGLGFIAAVLALCAAGALLLIPPS